MSGLGTIPAVCSSGSLMTNYARIGHAAQQVFPDILQNIIAIKENQHILHRDVIRNRYLNRNLRADEWSMINNVRTNGYVNFDIPLIYKLVRNLNLVAPPSKGWDFHMDPTVTEILPGDDIERIRRTRNKILHRGNAQVSDSNLTDYFTTFKDIATRLKFTWESQKENLYRKSHQIEIEEWEEQNKLFIKTDAVDSVLDSLKGKNCCTVIGTSGIGKSATIHHVALFLRDTAGYRIIPIHSPSDIESNFQRNQKQIFVIDDICGKSVIQTEVEKWIRRNDSTNQKLQIVRQYLPEPAVEQIKNDLDNYEFLPLMFALYKSLCKENEIFDVVKFFKNPFNIYTEEIDALHLLLDKTKFCALFFLVIFNGSLNVSVLTNCESEQDRQKREDFFEECGIQRNTLRQRILEQLESLVPLFVKSNYSLSRQVISFSAIHDKTFDFLCFYFGNKFQKSFLQFADSKMLYERTVLESLISPDKTVEDFTIWIADVNEDECGWTNPLTASCKHANSDIVRLLIEKGADVNVCCGLGLTPLLWSCKLDNSDIVRLLVEKGADVNLSDEDGHNPLIWSCKHDNSDIVRLLVEKGANVNVSDGDGDTPLIWSCRHDNRDIVRLLIEKGADINVSCELGLTDIVRLLIEKGADVNVSDITEETPLNLSCKKTTVILSDY
ncbi:unnamed protein product [Mytilus edulis]|uniref:DZIP3-like HEPN domain-containing protein n=1 Tax=Mytilus edulis TaxID=6550 RepID=A0A8S3PY59_MYTED|nr:unnamed protein product [Mytilus edulis]